MTEHPCRNCTNAAPFEGFDECLQCAVAIQLVEDPGYLAFAKRLYAADSAWLAALTAEWNRQASALMPAGQQTSGVAA